MQSVQTSPPVPQAVSEAPPLQMPFASQQPAVHVDAHTAALIGALQTLMGSVADLTGAPHVSPGVRHSDGDEQSWRGPMTVPGQDPI